MNKVLAAIIVAVAVIIANTAAGETLFVSKAEAAGTKVFLNDVVLAHPIVLDKQTYLPLKDFAVLLGWTYAWDRQSKSIMLSGDDWTVTLKANDNLILYNGKPTLIGNRAQVIKGTTYIPAREIVKLLGGTVSVSTAGTKFTVVELPPPQLSEGWISEQQLKETYGVSLFNGTEVGFRFTDSFAEEYYFMSNTTPPTILYHFTPTDFAVSKPFGSFDGEVNIKKHKGNMYFKLSDLKELGVIPDDDTNEASGND